MLFSLSCRFIDLFQHKCRGNKKHSTVGFLSLWFPHPYQLAVHLTGGMWSVFLLLCVSLSSQAEPRTWFPFPYSGLRVQNRCIDGCKWSQKYVFFCLYLGCFTITFFRHNLSLFFYYYFCFFQKETSEVFPVFISVCFCSMSQRGSGFCSVGQRATDNNAVRDRRHCHCTICAHVCVRVQADTVLSNLLLVLKWYYLSLFLYQK